MRKLLVVAALLATCASLVWCTPFGSTAGGGPADAASADGTGSLAPPLDGGAPFCSLVASRVFCADFDEGQPAVSGWTKDFTAAGGALAVDPIAGALRATTPSVGSTGTAFAFLEYAFQPTGSHVHVEARLRPVTTGGGQYSPFIISQNPDQLGYSALVLYVEGGKGTIQEETSNVSTQHALPSPFKNEWQRYAVDLDFSTSNPSFAVSVEGATVLTVPVSTYAWPGGLLHVDVGLAYMLTTEATGLEVDDVLITVP